MFLLAYIPPDLQWEYSLWKSRVMVGGITTTRTNLSLRWTASFFLSASFMSCGLINPLHPGPPYFGLQYAKQNSNLRNSKNSQPTRTQRVTSWRVVSLVICHLCHFCTTHKHKRCSLISRYDRIRNLISNVINSFRSTWSCSHHNKQEIVNLHTVKSKV